MDVREKYVMQKVNRKEKSICPNCIHHNLCIAENNQPCFECNRFIDANGVTVQDTSNEIKRLENQVAALKKSNRNWRRKVQRMRNRRKENDYV